MNNTISIIAYTDVWHDWRSRGVEGLYGENGVGVGEGVDTAAC